MPDIIFKMTPVVQSNLGYTSSVLKHSSVWLMGDNFNPRHLTVEYTEEIIKALDEDLVMDGALLPEEYESVMRKGVLYIFPKGQGIDNEIN